MRKYRGINAQLFVHPENVQKVRDLLPNWDIDVTPTKDGLFHLFIEPLEAIKDNNELHTISVLVEGFVIIEIIPDHTWQHFIYKDGKVMVHDTLSGQWKV